MWYGVEKFPTPVDLRLNSMYALIRIKSGWLFLAEWLGEKSKSLSNTNDFVRILPKRLSCSYSQFACFLWTWVVSCQSFFLFIVLGRQVLCLLGCNRPLHAINLDSSSDGYPSSNHFLWPHCSASWMSWMALIKTVFPSHWRTAIFGLDQIFFW